MIDTEKGKADVSRFAIDLAIRIALLAGVVYGSLQLLRPIIPTLLWAVILSVAVYPLFALLRRRLGLPRGVAATLLAVFLMVLVVAPVILLAGSAIDTLEGYARDLMRGEHLLPPPPDTIQGWPVVGPRLHEFWLNAANDMRAVLKDARMREQAGAIRKELGLLYADVERLSERVGNLDKHFGQAAKDIEEIRISSDKASKRARRLDNFDFEELAPDLAPVDPVKVLGQSAAE